MLMLEIHYDNPGLVAGVLDSSGVQLILTPNAPKWEAGTMMIGIEPDEPMSIVLPPGLPNFRYTMLISFKLLWSWRYLACTESVPETARVQRTIHTVRFSRTE